MSRRPSGSWPERRAEHRAPSAERNAASAGRGSRGRTRLARSTKKILTSKPSLSYLNFPPVLIEHSPVCA
jgi:hypothetical protein